eukprot:jgi/Mesvir1/24852/Mv22088-RA.1
MAAKLVINHPDLVDAKALCPDLVLDIRYATANNFLRQAVYPEVAASVCLLRPCVASQLIAAHATLQSLGYGLKVFDAYRPPMVQSRMWEILPDPRYVGRPGGKGSNHNRGAAVDVSLVARGGEELDMPTDFDDFSERAHKSFHKLPRHVKHHRQVLHAAMEKHGFIGLDMEWWHFDVVEAFKHDVIDECFTRLVTVCA